MAFDHVAAIILVGGQSSRMGADKASLVVNGRTMLAHVEATLRDAGVANVVIAGSDDVPDPDREVHGSQGPLAGIVAGWNHLQTSQDRTPQIVVVLACDMPSMTTEVIVSLVAEAETTTHGAIAHDGERPQPLVAAYRRVALDELVEAFTNGERSVRRCFDGWDLGTVHSQPATLVDADTPADLEGFDVIWPR